MKRTAELVLGIIGSVTLLLGIIFMFFMKMVIIASNFEEDFYRGYLESPQSSMQDAERAFGMVNSFISISLVTFSISLISGIVATVLVRKKAKLAGALFLIGGLIGFASIVPAILFIIAGIIAFARNVSHN